MYRAMTTSPTTPRNPPLMSYDESCDQPCPCISSLPALSSHHPENKSTTGVSSAVGGHQVTTARPPTLLERRERKLCGSSFPNLNVETLQGENQNAVTRDSDGSTIFRGWSKTDVGQSLATSSSSSSKGMVKLVSYNILAQRLVSTERYPHCPPFALAEDYRCTLLERELCQISPDIIALQEISVDVFERLDLLGGWLRSKYRFVGNHVVITDTRGRPMSWDDDATEDAKNVNMSGETTVGSPQAIRLDTPQADNTPGNGFRRHQRRSEMEGVAIFYLEERFEPFEVVPIRFNEIAAADVSLTERERRALQVGSHNVALVTVLRDRMKSNIIYVICTVHLIWQRTECQLWQTHHVLREMEQLKQKYEEYMDDSMNGPPLVVPILAGDFNADPTSPPVRYALTGAPPPGSDVVSCWMVPEDESNADSGDLGSTASLETNSDSGVVVDGGEAATVTASSGHHRGGCSTRKRYRITSSIGHTLSLHDSYTGYRGRHPCRVSAVNPSTNGEGRVLDHILVDERHVACTAVLRLSGLTELPTTDCPSDHYPVGVIITPRSLLT